MSADAAPEHIAGVLWYIALCLFPAHSKLFALIPFLIVWLLLMAPEATLFYRERIRCLAIAGTNEKCIPPNDLGGKKLASVFCSDVEQRKTTRILPDMCCLLSTFSRHLLI